MERTELRYRADGVEKFWEISLDEEGLRVRWGKVGARGTTRKLANPYGDYLLRKYQWCIEDKLRAGYYPVGEEPVAPLPGRPAASHRLAGPAKPSGVPSPSGAAEPKAGMPTDDGTPGTPATADTEARQASPPLPVSPLPATDLGLTLTPFEACYCLDEAVDLPPAPASFDPTAEAERAARITHLTPAEYDYHTGHWLTCTEPLLTALPSSEQVKWWREHLARLRGSDSPQPYWVGTDQFLPTWLQATLTINWDKSLRTVAGQLQEYGPDALLVRGLLARRPAAELVAARQTLPTPLPPPVQQVHGMWVFADRSILVAAALEVLEPQEARDLLATVPNHVLGQLNTGDAWVLSLLAPTPAERVAFARRTGARLPDWRGVVPWLVATGAAGFGQLLAWLAQADADVAPMMVAEVGRVAHGPGVVPFFLRALRTRGAAEADRWLAAHLPQLLAAHLPADLARAAVRYLREVPPAHLAAVAGQAAASLRPLLARELAAAALPELPTPTWWSQAVAARKLPRGGSVPFPVARLAPLVVDGHRLSQTQVTQLLRALAAGDRHPLVAQVAQRVSSGQRDAFALDLLELWLGAGAPTKHAWLLAGAGWLGGDGFVHELAPLIRAWPGASQHQRAARGLGALTRVGSDTALTEIVAIAEKAKFAGIKERAAAALEEVAAARGLRPEELEDRVLSTCGLDERGRRQFSYGVRRFVASVTPAGKLAVRRLDDGRPAGPVLASLPSARQTDDADAVAAARAEFQSLRKNVAAVAAAQVTRFERALVTGRRWPAADFERFIAAHPVLRGLLAGLVWAVWEGEELVASVRIDDDGTVVDVADRPVALAGRELSVAHPLDLGEPGRAGWARTLSDYELVPPFKQLDRPLLGLASGQEQELRLSGLPTTRIEPTHLAGLFKRGGWQPGSPVCGTVVQLHALPLRGVGLTPVLVHTGFDRVYGMAGSRDQQVLELFVLRGEVNPRELSEGDSAELADYALVPWGQVPPRVVSEVLGLLARVRG